MRRVIVNADDLGYDPEIDRGILEAHARGIVTSATAMTDTPFAPQVLAAAPASLGIGLHAVLDPDFGDPDEAAAELVRQIDRFRALRGVAPTHLDSHKHVHERPPILEAFARVASTYDLPVRALHPGMRASLRSRKVRTADTFVGDATLRPCWTPDRLVAALGSLTDGVTEVMCHPGYPASHARTSFRDERTVELASLCDPLVRQAIAAAGAVLIDYRGL